MEFQFLVRLVVLGSGALDLDRALHRAGRGHELSHDAVAGVLDLLAAVALQRRADDGVVGAHDDLRLLVAKPLGHRRRAGEVGEHHRNRRAGPAVRHRLVPLVHRAGQQPGGGRILVRLLRHRRAAGIEHVEVLLVEQVVLVLVDEGAGQVRLGAVVLEA